MHSIWSRLNSIFFFAIGALFALSVASAITTIWMPATFSATPIVRMNSLKALKAQSDDLRNGRTQHRDRALVSMDIDADLSGVFNWNVKQLFVFVKATFETKTNVLNEVIIWDRIVTRKEDALLRIEAPKNWGKYPIIDQKTELRGRLLNLSLHWDVMPYTGILYFGVAPATYVARLPTQYCLSEAPCSFTEVSAA